MISVKEAMQIVAESALVMDKESVPLSECIGRVLADPVLADRPVPPFDRVTMDGIAIDYSAFATGRRSFEIEHMAAAGSAQYQLIDSQKCVEVMTGAILPLGTDTVIRHEDLSQKAESFKINIDVVQGKNVHQKASDHPAGKTLMQVGQRINAMHINVLASVGMTHVQVAKMPRVAIISTGDELVPVDQMPDAHQIRRSNVHMLAARLKELLVPHQIYHLQDQLEEITVKLAELSDQYDVLILSGGVSKGKFDFVPDALDSLGFSKGFHRVAQRPGKPFWFGERGGVKVFALPGNPVSTLACFHKYFVPWLQLTLGQSVEPMFAMLDNDIEFRPALDYFAQASIVSRSEGLTKVIVRHGNGSGDIVSPITMDGFLELPADRSEFNKGESFPYYPIYPINY